MERFAAVLGEGDVVDGTYRVESMLSESERARVFVVTHVRFPEVPLVLKVATLAQTLDFERDTTALASLTGTSVARMFDRGKLPDGRLYRVVQRLAGPTLREALATSTFPPERAMKLVVALSRAVHEAHVNGIAPCDVSVDNLMFADGRNGPLCMMRVLAPNDRTPDSDQRALSVLRGALERANHGAWRPPSSLAELRAAIAMTGGPRSPDDSEPGAQIQRWEVVRRISETLRAIVYEVKNPNGMRAVLKVAGPEADREHFKMHAQLLAKLQTRHVMRVLDLGSHESTPYMVMEALHLSQATRLKEGGPFAIDAALQVVDELLWGADAIERADGAPSDFSLEHCYQATHSASPSVLTHAMMPLRTFRLYDRPQRGDSADAWSAAVALYELIAGRLPFPTSKHSLAKAWMGMPVALAHRRRDVPADISDLVHGILTGTRVTTAELRRELTRIRSAPATIRPSISPAPSGKPSLAPAFSVAPPSSSRTVVEPERRSLVPLSRGTARLSVPPPMPARAASADWALEVLADRCPLGDLAVACFSVDGREVVAVGKDAVARFRAGQWTFDPAREHAAYVACLIPMSDGGALALSSRGPLLRLGPTGGFRPWGVALERYVFASGVPDRGGLTLVGGTADRQRGVIARLEGETLTIVTDTLDVKPLTAAAPLPDGSLLATTEGGNVLHVRGRAITGAVRPCEVDLLAVARTGDTMLVVGAGSYAMTATTDPLVTTLEPVDTISPLGPLAIHADDAWCGSVGRILLRVAGHWRCVGDPFDGEPRVVALHVTAATLGAVLADGRLVLGRPR